MILNTFDNIKSGSGLSIVCDVANNTTYLDDNCLAFMLSYSSSSYEMLSPLYTMIFIKSCITSSWSDMTIVGIMTKFNASNKVSSADDIHENLCSLTLDDSRAKYKLYNFNYSKTYLTQFISA